jgi:hypothetical protein
LEVREKRIKAHLDNGRQVKMDPRDGINFVHGYAMTIHKSEGCTFERTYVSHGSPFKHSHHTGGHDTSSARHASVFEPKGLQEGLFYNFEDGRGGNIFSLTQQTKGLSFKEAVMYAAQHMDTRWRKFPQKKLPRHRSKENPRFKR